MLERKTQKKKEVSKVKFITTFNPALPSIDGLIIKYIHYLLCHEVLKKIFPNNDFSVIYNNYIFITISQRKRQHLLYTPNLALKVILLLLAVTNVTFVRAFWLEIVCSDVQQQVTPISLEVIWHVIHCVKSVPIRSYSGPRFPAFAFHTLLWCFHFWLWATNCRLEKIFCFEWITIEITENQDKLHSIKSFLFIKYIPKEKGVRNLNF